MLEIAYVYIVFMLFMFFRSFMDIDELLDKIDKNTDEWLDTSYEKALLLKEIFAITLRPLYITYRVFSYLYRIFYILFKKWKWMKTTEKKNA